MHLTGDDRRLIYFATHTDNEWWYCQKKTQGANIKKSFKAPCSSYQTGKFVFKKHRCIIIWRVSFFLTHKHLIVWLLSDVHDVVCSIEQVKHPLHACGFFISSLQSRGSVRNRLICTAQPRLKPVSDGYHIMVFSYQHQIDPRKNKEWNEIFKNGHAAFLMEILKLFKAQQ